MWGDRRGTEPRNARSALRTRAVLSGIALPLALAAAVFFGMRAVGTGEAVWWAETAIALVVVAVAAADLVVLGRRLR
ncbi:hypothetical protein Misp01_47980 [Microtetraspora sp. NBRC 13810]|uniref:DUF6343 family protein n=1 Tax=Microtetraspora sp. NBRC 13810 TaxID=3030990 RepID=UPI0024A58268|nr:DUF6343 family protein [Microtetraspora sp. NBRC 13810]GLW09669.1 hypothetical protein Misp01_47980 [Microtetraspora sp. NBRC 13810]